VVPRNKQLIFHFSFFIFQLPSPELITVGTNDKWRYNSRDKCVTTAAHRLESGLVRLARRAQVPYLNGARRNS
jgi:hypothetical protein